MATTYRYGPLLILALIQVLIIFITSMTNTTAFSQVTPKKVWWHDYRETLREKGAMDIPRPIKIKAININIASSTHTCTSSQSDETQDESHIATKLIHFQRHGQGYHNLLGDHTKALGKEFSIDDPNPECNPFVKPEIQDSPLTHKGRQEAAHQRTKASVLKPELVVVSPLHRAVQTALISFADHYHDGVPFLAHEGCREQLGLLTCNKALPISQTMADFPQIDFGLVTAGEEDSLWKPHRREEPVDEANRAYEFLTEFLMKRQENELAVVCHSAWLFSVCNAVIDCGEDESLESWFGTGEIRSLRVSFHRQTEEEQIQ